MESLFFTDHKNSHKKNGLLKLGLNEIAKNIQSNEPLLKTQLLKSYEHVFKFMDFDTFAKIKELYSLKEYEFIPTWEKYFDMHKIVVKFIPTNIDPIRLIFKDVFAGISQRDEHLIIYNNQNQIDWNDQSNQNLIRKPFFINLSDIDHARYFKLLKYLILKFYQSPNEYNANKLSKFGQQAALETNHSYILFEGRKLKSIGDCIKKEDDDGLKYLVEEIGLKPTINQMKVIERIFHEDIYDLVSYYFE